MIDIEFDIKLVVNGLYCQGELEEIELYLEDKEGNLIAAPPIVYEQLKEADWENIKEDLKEELASE